MANICSTSLSIQAVEGRKFANDDIEAIRKDIDETICYDGDAQFHSTSEDVLEMDIGTAWHVRPKELQEIAKRHRVNIRAVGKEEGCGYVGVACVSAAGQIVQDESLEYAF